MGEAMKELAEVKYALEDNVKQNFLEPLTHLQVKDLKDVLVSDYLFVVCSFVHLFHLNSSIARSLKVAAWTLIVKNESRARVLTSPRMRSEWPRASLKNLSTWPQWACTICFRMRSSSCLRFASYLRHCTSTTANAPTCLNRSMLE